MEPGPNSSNVGIVRSVSRCAAGVVFAVGLAVLGGWLFDVQALKSVHPSLVTMKANTATCFVLIGVSLWLLVAEPIGPARRRLGQACAFTVGAVGLLTLVEYLSGWNLGIDQLLFREGPQAVATSHPGRMAPNTALCFLCIGGVLLLRQGRAGARFWLSEALVHLAGLVGLVGLLGYIYGVSEFTGLAASTKMAVHTAVAFLVAYAGLVAARPERGLAAMLAWDCPGGMLLRRLLPTVIVLTILIGWLRVASERQGLTVFGTALRVTVDIVILGAALIVAARMLHRLDTGRKRAEQELQRLNTRLEQRTVELESVNAELEAFAYSVSHDLRAPLRAMDGFSQAVLEDYGDKLDAQGQHFLTRVREGARRMGELIDGLLRLSRVTRKEMSGERVDLSEMAKQVALELRTSQPGRQAEVRIQDGLVVRGDPTLLRAALENLLGNAWKFTGKKPSARVEFGSVKQGSEPVYFVRDNGAGFETAYADKIFVPFQRLHPATEFPGSGIGLATVQRIIHRHGGRIWAQGAPGEGATFYFTLKA